MDYYVSLADARRHIVRVRIHLAGTSSERDLQLPVWNGLYQIRDFAQNVRNFRAHDPAGKPLAVRKLDKTTWRVSRAESGAEVEYEEYVDQPGPFAAQFNSEHAFLNLAQILMYPTDSRDAQMTVTFPDIPSAWQIATVLPTLRPEEPSARGLFIARNYDRLVDAPIEMGVFKQTSFELDGATYRIAVHADPADYKMENVVASVRKIVQAGVSWMKDRPFSEYLFIYHFPHSPGGGGMEHAYCTAIEISAERLAEDPLSLPGITAHEFFHLWNVKRIRPESLEPVDYMHENYTKALWFSEGVTTAVGNVFLLRAGILDEPRYLVQLSREIRTLQLRQAHRTQSAEESSLDTWFDKYPQYRLPERSISYYNKGEVLGVMLDLELRRVSSGKKSLRDLFQWMNTYYANGGRFFPDSEGVRTAAETVTNSDFESFFRNYVSGTEELPYNQLFATVGLKLVQKTTVTPTAGFIAVKNFDAPPQVVNVDEGSEAERAGMVPGDTILAIEGKPAMQEVDQRVASLGMKPGDVVRLRISGRKGTREIKVHLGSSEQTEFAIADTDVVTPAQRARRNAWLAGEDEK